MSLGSVGTGSGGRSPHSGHGRTTPPCLIIPALIRAQIGLRFRILVVALFTKRP